MPSELRQPCNAAQVVPDNVTFGQALEIATLDGANLDQCQDKHLAVISVVDAIEQIQGAKP